MTCPDIERANRTGRFNPFKRRDPFAGHPCADGIRDVLVAEPAIAELAVAEPSPVWRARAHGPAVVMAPVLARVRDHAAVALTSRQVLRSLEYDSVVASVDRRVFRVDDSAGTSPREIPVEDLPDASVARVGGWPTQHAGYASERPAAAQSERVGVQHAYAFACFVTAVGAADRAVSAL